MDVLKKLSFVAAAMIAIVTISVAMTQPVKADIPNAQPLYMTPDYQAAVLAQQNAMLAQQALTLQLQDNTLSQQEQQALLAQAVALVQQQQQMGYLSESTLLTQYQAGLMQQYLGAQQTYNNSVYLQQMAAYRANLLNNLQASQRTGFQSMIDQEALNYMYLMNEDYLKNKNDAWLVYKGYWGIK